MNSKDKLLLLSELSEALIEVWYAAEDYGQDEYTKVMTREVSEVEDHQR